MNLYQNAIHRFNDQINPDVTQQGEVTGLPPVTAADNGKVAKVVSGAWAASNENELPAVTAEDNGKVLKVTEGVWVAGAEATELPAVTASDNGKVLTVANGVWSAQAGGGSTHKYQHNVHAWCTDSSSTHWSYDICFSFISDSATPLNYKGDSVVAEALKSAGFVAGTSNDLICPATGWFYKSDKGYIASGIYSNSSGNSTNLIGVPIDSTYNMTRAIIGIQGTGTLDVVTQII